MRKRYITFLLVILCNSYSNSQETIVNYINHKGELVSKKDASSIELITKSDSLWLLREYYTNGRLKKEGHYKTKDKEIPIGKFVSFYRNDSLASVQYYNSEGQRRGKYMSWFEDGKISSTGTFINNMKEGIWQYYHYNGAIASKLYYQKDSILKAIVFDDQGGQINDALIEEKLPIFEGGQKMLQAKIRKLAHDIPEHYKNLDLQMYVNFRIGIDGEMTDVSVDEKIPRSIENYIKYHFEQIIGWQPAIHMSRKIPAYYRMPMIIKASTSAR